MAAAWIVLVLAGQRVFSFWTMGIVFACFCIKMSWWWWHVGHHRCFGPGWGNVLDLGEVIDERLMRVTVVETCWITIDTDVTTPTDSTAQHWHGTAKYCKHTWYMRRTQRTQHFLWGRKDVRPMHQVNLFVVNQIFMLTRFHCRCKWKSCSTEVRELARSLISCWEGQHGTTISSDQIRAHNWLALFFHAPKIPRYGAHLPQMVANGLDRVGPGFTSTSSRPRTLNLSFVDGKDR